MCDFDVMARGVDRQAGRGGSPQRPPDKHDGTVGMLADEINGREQVGSPAVVGVGVPIGRHHDGAVVGEHAGKWANGRAGIGLHSVPQQDRGLRPIAVHVGQPSWGVLHRFHGQEGAQVTEIQSQSRSATSYGEGMKSGSLTDKVIAVTGGARGIGLAIATTAHGVGARVAIGDIDEAAVKESGDQKGFALSRGLDVTNRESFTGFLDAVETTLGPLDVLVNNAGVIAVGSAVDEADNVTQQLLGVNIFGVILGTKLAAQRMLPRRRGHIVNIASLGGVLPTEGIATYCATKHAVLGYTDAVRLENRGSGVHFSAILPTLTNTEMTAGIGHAKGFKNAEPQDVADAVVSVIARPESRVFVPRSMGITVASQRLMPLRVAEAMGRALGSGRVFTSDVQSDKRKGYADRTGTS